MGHGTGAGHAGVKDNNPFAGFFKDQAALLNSVESTSPQEQVNKLHIYLATVAKYKGATAADRNKKAEKVRKVMQDYGLLGDGDQIKYPEVRAWFNSHPAEKQKVLAVYAATQRTILKQ